MERQLHFAASRPTLATEPFRWGGSSRVPNVVIEQFCAVPRLMMMIVITKNAGRRRSDTSRRSAGFWGLLSIVRIELVPLAQASLTWLALARF